MPTPRLYQLFRKMTGWSNPLRWGFHWCCSICKEWWGTKEEYQKEVIEPSRPFWEYRDRIHAELKTRPDAYSHRNKSKKNKRPSTVKRNARRR